MNRICTKCGLEKDVNDFRLRDKKRGIRQSWCKKCMSEYEKTTWSESEHRRISNKDKCKDRRMRNRIHVLNILSSKRCEICGEDDPVVLEFHHTVADNKFMEISKMIAGAYSIEKINKEIEKCIVLCANCYARETAKQFGYYKYINR